MIDLVKDFYRDTFYYKYSIDKIENGVLQEIIFDWIVNSGYWGNVGVQNVLNQLFDEEIDVDGFIGIDTIAAINNSDSLVLFNAIKSSRVDYYHAIAKSWSES